MRGKKIEVPARLAPLLPICAGAIGVCRSLNLRPLRYKRYFSLRKQAGERAAGNIPAIFSAINCAATGAGSKAGPDTMRGGTGDNTYIINNAGDMAFEAAGQSIDTVKSSVTYTLCGNVENRTLTGVASVNATGNALDNVITGDNLINGGRGNDLLIGGGSDTSLFDQTLAANIDTVANFAAANDRMQLDQTIFTALTTLGTLSAATFFVGAAAQDADDRIIYNSATGGLFYDRDGTGAIAAVQFATLTGTSAITNTNFTVVTRPSATARDPAQENGQPSACAGNTLRLDSHPIHSAAVRAIAIARAAGNRHRDTPANTREALRDLKADEAMAGSIRDRSLRAYDMVIIIANRARFELGRSSGHLCIGLVNIVS